MKTYFPPQDQNFLQTNRSNKLGNLWSSLGLDFQSNLRKIRLGKKLVINTGSADDADLGRPVAFKFGLGVWWAICGTRMFKTADSLATSAFSEDTTAYFSVGAADSRFDVTNPGGTTFRYTYDGTGTDPGITALTFPIGASVIISGGSGFAAGNEGTFTVTGSGANYFEVTNAAGVVEADKTITASDYIAVSGGSLSTSFSTEVSDMETFDDRIWVTTTVGLYSRSSTSAPWILQVSFSGATTHRPLVYFQRHNRLYFKYSGVSVGSIDEDDVAVISTGDFFIDLGNTVAVITTLEATGDYIFIGSRAGISVVNSGLKGTINQWDGISSATTEHPLESVACLAMAIDNKIPYAIDANGRILEYTGYTFKETQRFPIDKVLLNVSLETTPTNGRFVHPNGFISSGNGTLLVLVNNLMEDAGATILENLPSGVWELDLATKNFTHKHSFNLKKNSSSTILDYGQNRILGAGALASVTSSVNSSAGRSTILAGASFYTTASATASAIFIDSPENPTTDNEGQRRGYTVQTWIDASDITEVWQRIWEAHCRFENSADKASFKFRFTEDAPVEATITWSNETQFTTTTDVSAYDPSEEPFDGIYGGEVEILQGTGGGSCTHISSVEEDGGTYTVTLDTAVTGVSGTAKARFQKWRKLLPESTGQDLEHGSFPVSDDPSVRIQVKMVLELTGDGEFYKYVVQSEPDLKITA